MVMINEHAMDLVYLVRPGDDNEHLRYSLRSLINFPHRDVIIVGHKPKWVHNVRFIERNQDNQTDLENTNRHLKRALEEFDDLTDNFVLMNDDFMFMEPVEDIPAWHQGLLADRITNYQKTVMAQAYSLMKTRDELRRLGAAEPYYSYELHIPFVYNKKKLTELFELTELKDIALRPRTLYGNYYQIKGKEQPDVKGTKPVQSPFYSTEGATFRSTSGSEGSRGSRGEVTPGTAQSVLRRTFTNAGRYER